LAAPDLLQPLKPSEAAAGCAALHLLLPLVLLLVQVQ
jgi:hypothetical protein